MRHRLFAALSGLMIVSMILSACAPAATPAPPTSALAATQPPAKPTQPPPPTNPPAPTATPKPKVVRVTFTQEPNNLNPYYTDMWFSAVVRDLYLANGLIVYNDKAEAIPWVAKEIPSAANGGISADGKTITYKLREDVKWSDGEPLTADDYVFTWQMVMSDKNKVISRDPFDTAVDKVEAKDKYTLVVTFKEPYAPWPAKIFSNVNATNAIPKHILEPVFQKDGTIDNADWNRKPTVSVGPFVFKDWQSGSHLIFQANPDFWLGKPKVDQIFVKIVPDDAAQIAAIKAGESDIGTFIGWSDVPDLQKLGTVDVPLINSGYKDGWFFNLSTNPKTKGHPALQDVNVRRALAMAIDREKFDQDVLYGLTKPYATLWDGTPYGNAPDLKPIPYDKAAAEKLLDDAGWKKGPDGIRAKDGVKLKLRYATNMREDRKKMQVYTQQAFKDIGVEVELINHASDLFFEGYDKKGPIATGQYDIAQWSTVSSFPDPDYSSWLCKEVPSDENPSGTNWQALCDKELDALFAKQASTVDTQARIQIFHEIGKMILDKVYWVCNWDDSDLWSVSKKLQNIKLSGANMFWNAGDWDIQQ